MDLNVANLIALVRESLTRPRDGAARILSLNVPDDARWLGFVIVVVLSVLIGQLAIVLMGEGGMQGGLLFMAVFQTMLLLGMVVAVQGVGRALGGTGTFPDTLLLVAWLQFVMLVFQLAQIVALLVIPPLFTILAIVGAFYFLWMLTNFVMVLHGFTSSLKVFVGIIFTFFGMAMVLTILLGMLGLAPGAM